MTSKEFVLSIYPNAIIENMYSRIPILQPKLKYACWTGKEFRGRMCSTHQGAWISAAKSVQKRIAEKLEQ